jgi:hypothetical protein
MYVSVYVCMYVCIYEHNGRWHACMYVSVYVCMYVCMYVFMNIMDGGMHVYMYLCMYAYMYKMDGGMSSHFLRIYTHTYMHTYIHALSSTSFHISNVFACVYVSAKGTMDRGMPCTY